MNNMPPLSTLETTEEIAKPKTCGMKTEVYSRVVGYYRPVQNWHIGKQEEFRLRKPFSAPTTLIDREEFRHDEGI